MADKNIQFKQSNGAGFDKLFPLTLASLVDYNGATLAGILGTTATDITGLKSMDTSQGTLITNLTTRVTATETVNGTQTTNITNLTNRVTATETVNGTQTTNISNLTTKVTALENATSILYDVIV